MWSVSPTRFPPGSDRISFKRQELERIMPSHVFIVGGMSGIGLAVAAKLKGRGYAVTIAERDPAMPEAAHRSLGDVVAAATPPIRPWSRRRSPAPSRSIILFSPFGSGKGQGRLAASRSKPYGGVLRRKRCAAHRLRPGRFADVAASPSSMRQCPARSASCGERCGRLACSDPRRRIATAACQWRRARSHKHALGGLSASRSAQSGVRRLRRKDAGR
jgi:glycine/D-amino acid oxidase-like deaminating enzyme